MLESLLTIKRQSKPHRLGLSQNRLPQGKTNSAPCSLTSTHNKSFASSLVLSHLSAKHPKQGGTGILTIEHLTLRTQSITLGHQIINLLSPLQHTLNSLVQHDLCLIQLLLDLHDTVRLLRVLVFHNVVLQFGKAERRGRVGP